MMMPADELRAEGRVAKFLVHRLEAGSHFVPPAEDLDQLVAGEGSPRRSR
jgi:hypothetical protein